MGATAGRLARTWIENCQVETPFFWDKSNSHIDLFSRHLLSPRTLHKSSSHTILPTLPWRLTLLQAAPTTIEQENSHICLTICKINPTNAKRPGKKHTRSELPFSCRERRKEPSGTCTNHDSWVHRVAATAGENRAKRKRATIEEKDPEYFRFIGSRRFIGSSAPFDARFDENRS